MSSTDEPTALPEGRVGAAAIAREFVGKFPGQFASLFGILLLGGMAATTAVLAVVPLVDYLLNPSLTAPNRVTRAVVGIAALFGLRTGFWLFGLVFVGANVIKGLLDIATRYAVQRIKYTVQAGITNETLAAFLAARWEFFSGADQGKLLNTLNREVDNIGDTMGRMATQLSQLVQLVIYLIVPLWLNPRMTVLALGLAAVFGAPLLLLQRTSYRLGQRMTETSNELYGALREMLDGARLIIGFGRQEPARARFAAVFEEHAQAASRWQALFFAPTNLFQPLGMLAAVIAMGLALARHVAVAEMAALLYALLRIVPLLGDVLTAHISINSFLPSYEQLLQLRQQARRAAEVSGSKRFERLQQGLELRQVEFTYPGRTETLRGIDLSIQQGKTTALVGESGSGKSTITDLVLGLQIPSTGAVLLDGEPLSTWNQNSFRERIGYVPQDPFLFHASIRENLLWSFPTATEQDLWQTLAVANASRVVAELPQGIDTVVGDRGTRLSGGQRQRIALARALLRKPDLLILDEATSALDSESERLIQDSIDALAHHTTMLIVAHRLSTIRGADCVYVLRDGRIVEHGSPLQLSLEPSSVFARMIQTQHAVSRNVVPLTT